MAVVVATFQVISIAVAVISTLLMMKTARITLVQAQIILGTRYGPDISEGRV